MNRYFYQTNKKYIIKIASIVLLLSFFCSCKVNKNIYLENEYLSPWETKLESEKTRSFREGEEYGEKSGFEDGQSKGFENGLIEGKKRGLEESNRIIEGYKDLLKKKNNAEDCGPLLEQTRTNALKQGEDIGEKRGYKLGFINGEKVGYDVGLDDGYDKGIKENLNQIISRKSEHVNFRSERFRSGLDYDSILNRLNSLTGNRNLDSIHFYKIVDDIQSTIINFIVEELGLSENEEDDLKYEYRYTFSDLTKNYYDDYFTRLSLQNNINEEYIKYFEEYHRADQLTKVLATGICTVVNVALSFAKANPLINVTVGFLCEDLLTNVFSLIEDDLLKVSIFREYNTIRSVLKSQSVNLISELAVTEFSRTYSKYKKKRWLLSEAEIKINIDTKLKIGFDLNDFDIIIDHEKMKFIVLLPNKPKILSQSQIPIFLSIETGFFVSINSGDLNQLFGEAMNETKNALYDYGIDEIAKRKAVNVLKSLFYPIIAIPRSQYSVEINFRDKKYEIYP